MIVKHPSFVRAENIIGLVLSNVRVYENKNLYKTTIYIKPYQNGRENGLILEGPVKCITVSENRNSDHIVVYIGTPPLSYGVSEDAYRNAKYFNSDESAVKYIIDNIEQLTWE